MNPQNLLQAYQLFLELPETKANNRLKDNLKTTLKRYILPSYNFENKELQDNFEGCLEKVSLRKFQDAANFLQESLESSSNSENHLSPGSIRNYRSAFNRFHSYLKSQSWYSNLLPLESDINLAPRVRDGNSINKDVAAKRYMKLIEFEELESSKVSFTDFGDLLVSQVKELDVFWISADNRKRRSSPMSPQMFKCCLNAIHIFVSWLVSEKLVNKQDLSLSLLVDQATLEDFIEWGIKNLNKDKLWAIDIVKVTLAVAKWLNHQESKWFDFRDIPIIVELQNYIHELEQIAREDKKYYVLKLREMNGNLKNQYQDIKAFFTKAEVPTRKTPPIAEVTFKTYSDNICRVLGWQFNIKNLPLNELDLKSVANIDVLKEYIAWGINIRGNGYGWATQVGYTGLAVAKWLNPHSKRHNFSDIEQVEEIREYIRYLREQHNHEDSRQNLDEKRISFEEAQQVVEYLKKCCNPLDKYGDERSDSAVMKSWQRYLIVAILTYCPVRQREIRELEVGVTLFREADGYWVKLSPKQHKAGKKTGKGREYRLPQNLTADLDEWLSKWRPTIHTSHKRVFICMGSNNSPQSLGNLLEADDVTDLVVNIVYKATSILFNKPRGTTPHIFRRIAITYQRRYGRPEQREALAELMGHSVFEAERTYNEETNRERTLKADNWWELQSAPTQLEIPNIFPQPGFGLPEDDEGFKHLGTSSYSHDALIAKRDRVLLMLWSLHDWKWVNIHRLNVGDVCMDEKSSGIRISSSESFIPVKSFVIDNIDSYLKMRKENGETISDDSPLFIGVGNRSQGGRLTVPSLQFLIEKYFGRN
ncbi:hypothetical protein [Anabaena azotica]|uniref:hypothetical protein n=1 Tax=Anabaena azotica TaxID=197653 RepID=UPI0039A5FCF0